MDLKKKEIEGALHQFASGNLADNAKELLKVLGYESQRTMRLEPNTVEGFISAFNLDDDAKFNSERALTEEWESIDLLFQLTEEEIGNNLNLEIDFGDGGIDEARMESYLFFAIKLSGDHYTRTQLSQITREMNKAFGMPAMILFQHGKTLTFAVIDRRLNIVDESKDVLLKATLIKDINFADPHRAHIDILSDLSIDELYDEHKFRNFPELHDAWKKTLDTELLNREFYRRLFNWFEWAVSEARFPKNEKRIVNPDEHVIRLITRLLFVWFIKEKGLVSDKLFDEKQVERLLKGFKPDSGDSYYRAILQNLFFATLNTEIEKREFSPRTNAKHRNFSLYRYKQQISAPDKLLTLFAQTPFINGGLFDCLDSEEATRDGGYRIDCFSDEHYDKLSIPNRLFFHGERGLIPLLNHYKFTVEENTPIEQEVALDPELLGKVFENLLAAYNPETGATARKLTGSYYTPRAIVDYMVEEALVATLAERVKPTDGDAKFWEERLRYMFNYAKVSDDASEWFDSRESDELVRTISELKILDPAVGSGAFPMGILHKLTLALQRLDSDNTRWEQLQKERAIQRAAAAFDTKNRPTRDEKLKEISRIFENYSGNFGRKLYLIQNSIFGLDIQSIACQIAKLRFFISLAIEQEPTSEANNNFGIKPLPNLETRFVAANTLIGLDVERTLTSSETKALQGALSDNRERHFHATTRSQKLACKKENRKLRQELATELRHIGMPANDAEKVAAWDPYDQHGSADWFDLGRMFGITDGFDVVVGNPPYINIENLPDTIKNYLFENYQACSGRTDIYIAFLEKSISILNANGFMSFILPSAFATQQYGEKMRQTLIRDHAIREVVDASSYRIFENAAVYNIVLTVGNTKGQHQTEVRLHSNNADFDTRGGTVFCVDQHAFSGLKDSRLETNPLVFESLDLREKIWQRAVRFDRICFVAYGARLNHRTEKLGKQHYISQSPIPGAKRFCEGKDIERYSFSQEGWLDYTPHEHYNPMFPELFENEKLMIINVVKDQLRFAYDGKGFYNSHTVLNCVRLDLLSRASHVSARRAMRNADKKFAKQFSYGFLLGVLNSRLINWYFQSFLSESLHFYPNDAKQLPIPNTTSEQQTPIVQLVDKVLDDKHAIPDADTSALEKDIDELVYSLYELTLEEIAIVEEATI